MKSPIIQWYPGHIAKAEKHLKNNLNKVDLIIEVRDARIPHSTSHPSLKQWINNKKHILVINRKDMISESNLKKWDHKLINEGKQPFWCNAKIGQGINEIKEAAVRTGTELNARRLSRGMLARPIRALTLGFPNVGKSALINQLMKRKIVASARRAGVTKSLHWVRLGKGLDLLDAPGILPPQLDDQKSALKLAICDDIGEAAYDVELVAIAFLNLLEEITGKNSVRAESILQKRYGIEMKIDFKNSHEWLKLCAIQHTSGDTTRMAQRFLDDFRKLLLGPISLELP